MFQIKNIHYNSKTEFIYLICLSQTGLYYCSIYKKEKNYFNDIYFIGYKTKDTDYKLNNPTDITIHPITNDIAIAEYNKGIIRLYSGSNYKFIKNYGNIESFENNSSNSNAKYKAHNISSKAMMACAYGFRYLYRQLKYKLLNVTGIRYSLDGNTLFIVDTNGISILHTDKDVLCSIMPIEINKSTLKTEYIYPYKIEVLDDKRIIASISNLNNISNYDKNIVRCNSFIILDYTTGQKLEYIYIGCFSWFDIGMDKYIYMFSKNKMKIKKLNLNDKSIVPYNLTDNNNNILEYTNQQYLFTCGNINEIFLSYNNQIVILQLINDNYTKNTDFLHDEKEKNTKKLNKTIRTQIKSGLKTKFTTKIKNANTNNKQILNNLEKYKEIFTDEDTLYIKLLLNKSSTQDQIKTAYKNLVRKYHPDKIENENSKGQYSNIFNILTELYKNRTNKKKNNTSLYNSYNLRTRVNRNWVPSGKNIIKI